jgi:hypothetical protein
MAQSDFGVASEELHVRSHYSIDPPWVVHGTLGRDGVCAAAVDAASTRTVRIVRGLSAATPAVTY